MNIEPIQGSLRRERLSDLNDFWKISKYYFNVWKIENMSFNNYLGDYTPWTAEHIRTGDRTDQGAEQD